MSKNKTTKNIIALISLGVCLIISCQPKWTKTLYNNSALPVAETIYVCIDTDESANEKITIAITSWDNSIGIWKHFVPVIGINKNCNIKIIEVPEEQEADPRVVARAFMTNNNIHLFKGRHEKDTIGIVLHEIGHLLGAKHMEGTLMDPVITYKKYVCPDAATLAQVAIIHDVDPLLFKPCKN